MVQVNAIGDACPIPVIKTLHALQDQGIDTFIEVGPGKTLSGLVKRTLSDVRVYSCETAEQVAAIADELA